MKAGTLLLGKACRITWDAIAKHGTCAILNLCLATTWFSVGGCGLIPIANECWVSAHPQCKPSTAGQSSFFNLNQYIGPIGPIWADWAHLGKLGPLGPLNPLGQLVPFGRIWGTPLAHCASLPIHILAMLPPAYNFQFCHGFL